MKKQSIGIAVVLLVAAFLRLYRIGELTEFLGDQGRTGIHIYQAWKDRILPLVGPTVLSGQHLGPAFYYIMAPFFVLGGFNPLVPAIATAAGGTAATFLLFLFLKKRFDWGIASLVSLLYAVSPAIITSERTLWEPNIIPFFSFGFIYCAREVLEERKYSLFLILGVIVGVLVQLHYPNTLFLLLSLLLVISAWRGCRSLMEKGKLVCGVVSGVCTFVLVVSPFLWYETTHTFENTRGVIQSVLLSNEAPLAKQTWLRNVIDYASRLFNRVIPLPLSWQGAMLLLAPASAVLIRDFWLRFLGFWLVAGLTLMAAYRGVVYDHYLYFLLPVPFLLSGYLLSFLHKVVPRAVLVALVIWLAAGQIKRGDWRKSGPNDIARTRALTDEIIAHAGGQPFSFTLISSRSFSDLHYRYFFTLLDVLPETITSPAYQQLFLICEKEPCPRERELSARGSTEALCYEDHCRGPYPSINLLAWNIASLASVEGGVLYKLTRIGTP